MCCRVLDEQEQGPRYGHRDEHVLCCKSITIGLRHFLNDLLKKGGSVLGNGTWLNVGGNQAVKPGGEAADSQNGGGYYNDPDGRNS